MSSALRALVFCAAIVALGCPSSRQSEGTAPADRNGDDHDDAGGGDGDRPGPRGDCGQRTCAYHAGADRYHACYHAAAGACVRFGPVCEPADGCMFDRERKAYRHCERAAAGRCLEFGEPCAPEGGCMIDPDGELHHECDDIVDGRCARYGPPCEPAQTSAPER